MGVVAVFQSTGTIPAFIWKDYEKQRGMNMQRHRENSDGKQLLSWTIMESVKEGGQKQRNYKECVKKQNSEDGG
jgi:hypothetical protein